MLESARSKDNQAEQSEESNLPENLVSSTIVPANGCLPSKANHVLVNDRVAPSVRSPTADDTIEIDHSRPWEEVDFADLVEITGAYSQSAASTSKYFPILFSRASFDLFQLVANPNPFPFRLSLSPSRKITIAPLT